jgi:hypothetical protein
MFDDDDDDFDCNDLDVSSIQFIYQLRHSCNVLGSNEVAKILQKDCNKIEIICNSNIHGSNSFKDILNLKKKSFTNRIKELEHDEYEEQERKEQAEYKNHVLTCSLMEKRQTFAGIGTNKAKRRLNKLALNDSIAKAVRLAIEIEDKNITAKSIPYFEYRERKYKVKGELIDKLIDLFKEQNWTYGIQQANNYSCSHVIYFEIPDCEQLSWHFTLDKDVVYPTYEKEWDGLENSSLIKLEKTSIELLKTLTKVKAND